MKYFIIFWLVGSFCLAQVNESFDKANQLYNSGNYQRALSTYTSILDASQHSASLYYNIANCHYKLNKIALSIYYYEKALLLDPKDEDIINNLSFAQKMTVDAIQEIPKNGLSKLFVNRPPVPKPCGNLLCNLYVNCAIEFSPILLSKADVIHQPELLSFANLIHSLQPVNETARMNIKAILISLYFIVYVS